MILAQMPILRPIPIKTKNAGYFNKYKNWIFGTRNWMIMEDWRFQIGKDRWVLIHKEFIFNGASIPKIFWSILSPTGILLIPALVHDFAYTYGYIWIIDEHDEVVKFGADKERKYWDELFKKTAIRVNGFKGVNNISWWMLKAFGWIAWNKSVKERTVTPNN